MGFTFLMIILCFICPPLCPLWVLLLVFNIIGGKK